LFLSLQHLARWIISYCKNLTRKAFFEGLPISFFLSDSCKVLQKKLIGKPAAQLLPYKIELKG